jgi:hypothetical protein
MSSKSYQLTGALAFCLMSFLYLFFYYLFLVFVLGLSLGASALALSGGSLVRAPVTFLEFSLYLREIMFTLRCLYGVVGSGSGSGSGMGWSLPLWFRFVQVTRCKIGDCGALWSFTRLFFWGFGPGPRGFALTRGRSLEIVNGLGFWVFLRVFSWFLVISHHVMMLRCCHRAPS